MKTITIEKDKLKRMLMEAYRHGYASFEMIDAGLESYDAEGYANWSILKLK